MIHDKIHFIYSFDQVHVHELLLLRKYSITLRKIKYSKWVMISLQGIKKRRKKIEKETMACQRSMTKKRDIKIKVRGNHSRRSPYQTSITRVLAWSAGKYSVISMDPIFDLQQMWYKFVPTHSLPSSISAIHIKIGKRRQALVRTYTWVTKRFQERSKTMNNSFCKTLSKNPI